ncbi:hypothetical protein [Sporosarcina sp. A2]
MKNEITPFSFSEFQRYFSLYGPTPIEKQQSEGQPEEDQADFFGV